MHRPPLKVPQKQGLSRISLQRVFIFLSENFIWHRGIDVSNWPGLLNYSSVNFSEDLVRKHSGGWDKVGGFDKARFFFFRLLHLLSVWRGFCLLRI
jgi:hypothetical protein